MITQNRDKPQNVVNGEMASVEICHNATVILKLPGNKLVATNLVTYVWLWQWPKDNLSIPY